MSIVDCVQVSRQLGNLMDLYPTLLELAGVSVPSDRIIDGISLVNALLKSQGQPRYKTKTVLAPTVIVIINRLLTMLLLMNKPRSLFYEHGMILNLYCLPNRNFCIGSI